MPPETLAATLDRTFAGITRARDGFTPSFVPIESGTITTVSTGIATIVGLPGVGYEELIKFPGGLYGIAFNVDENEVGVVLLGEYSHLQTGDEVQRTGRVMDVGVGPELLGRTIDPLGRPLDGGESEAQDRWRGQAQVRRPHHESSGCLEHRTV